MLLKQDCRHFPGDRPCTYHKETGVHCPECEHYEVADRHILIIKLDAIGDVLRTTSILPGLREKYPKAHITWVTLNSATAIFHQNKLVDAPVAYESPETLPLLSVKKFDLVINLDSSPKSSALTSFVHAKEKLGFGLNEQGKVFCLNKEAEPWFEMGAFDDIKKKNVKTYQQLMLEICRLQTKNFEIILSLSMNELERTKQFREGLRLPPTAFVIGMNTGASERWEMKKWTLEGYKGLIQKIVSETEHVIVLYGGKQEYERNLELQQVNPQRVHIANTENSLREFFSLLSASDIVITGDTLALHAATALQKRVIAIFGPTSIAEIETYGRVRKVVSDVMECQCYYRPVCTETTNCMNTISTERIYAILQEEIQKLPRH
ncbi:MAG: glycosyltransferase family 9 protein [Bacteroidetes bacterium]|nr:MAG: glycosyltransferase family 9 protein [Bacteroidota bacterium]